MKFDALNECFFGGPGEKYHPLVFVNHMVLQKQMSSIITAKTLAGDLLSIETSLHQSLSQFKTSLVKELRQYDHHVTDTLLSVFTTECECEPDTAPLSTWFAQDPYCSVFVRSFPEHLVFTDVTCDEKADMALTIDHHKIQAMSTHLNYVINNTTLPMGEPAYLKAVISGITERHFVFVGFTMEKATTFNKYIHQDYENFSASRDGLCAYGVSHHAAVISSRRSSARIPNQGSTTSQELWIGYYPGEQLIKMVVFTPGKVVPYETCMKLQRSRQVQEHMPVYLIVTTTAKDQSVEFSPCSLTQQSRVDSVTAFPR